MKQPTANSISVPDNEAESAGNNTSLESSQSSSDEIAQLTDKDPQPKELGGRDGPDPTRFGDWEKSGRCIDF